MRTVKHASRGDGCELDSVVLEQWATVRPFSAVARDRSLPMAVFVVNETDINETHSLPE